MSNQVYKNPVKRYDLVNGGIINYGLSGNENIVNATPTKLLNWTSTSQTNMDEEVAYANGDFTIKKSGVYAISYTVAFASDAVGDRHSYFTHTESGGMPSNYAEQFNATSSSGTSILSGSATIFCQKDDVIKVYAEQTSGSGLDVVQGFSFVRISKIL